MSGMGRKLVVGAVLGVVVLVALGIYADARALAASLSTFQWPLLFVALGLTLLNYFLRFLKWHFYLHTLGERVDWVSSALVFLGGLSMAVTPGKFGELLKALLLKERSGVPATKTASVVVSERLTDFLALIFLAAGGVLGSAHGTTVLGVAVGGSVVFLACVSSERLSMWVIGVIAKFPLGDKIAPKLEEIYRAMAQLVRPIPLIGTTALSVAAWFCECVGFHIILTGLTGTSSTLGDATFIYAFATIFGAVTMLPGGLGVTEGSLIGLLMSFGLATARETATAGALLIRFCTLWFAVIVGLVALTALRRAGTDASSILPVDGQPVDTKTGAAP